MLYLLYNMARVRRSKIRNNNNIPVINVNNNINNNDINNNANANFEKKRWSIDDINCLLNGYKNKKSFEEIAQILKRSVLSVKLKFENYVTNNRHNLIKLTNELGLQENELLKIIICIEEKNEIYLFKKNNNLSVNLDYQDIKKIYMFEKKIPVLKKMVEYYTLKKQLDELTKEGLDELE